MEESRDHTSGEDVSCQGSPAAAPLQRLNAEDFMNLVRFGATLHLRHVLDKDNDLVNLRDVHGNTCLHWAARRGDLDVFTLLTKLNPANLLEKSTNETEMYPIHWAASQGHLKIVQYIIEQSRNAVDLSDHTGSTPLMIAVQYNFLSIAIYLINQKCDLFAKDSNGDTALHWAAYKGHDTMIEVLMYFMSQCLENEDNFGQTPLHLAAMKGHVTVVKTLVGKYEASVRKRDRQGYTALDHAMQKGLLVMELTLRKLTSSSTLEVARGLGWKKLMDKRALAYLFFGMNEKEQGCWMWRVIALSNGYATYASLCYAMSVAMADLMTLHMANTIIQSFWWIAFLMCLFKEPGFVTDKPDDESNPLLPNSSTYGDYLAQGFGGEDAQAMSSGHRTAPAVQLCHTCKVRRPLRSKHCKVQEKCVLKFDHFCPYVYNTIGRDNYKYFFSLLCIHPVAYVCFAVSSYYYVSRVGASISYILFLVYSTLMLLMMLGLLSYHVRLVTRDLTTNEDVNVHKYAYLWNEYNDYSNPFRRQKLWESVYEVFFPDNRLYYSRKEALQARAANN